MFPAIVAVTEHVPADVDVNELDDSEQPDADPSATTYVTAPDVDPPDVANETAVPYVPDVDVTDNGACDAFATVTDTGTVVDAPSYVPSDAILAEIEHEPAPVIVTTPVDGFTEHAEPDAEYVTVPEPTDGDADTENDASPYVFEYEVTENDNDLDANVISAVTPVGCDTE